MLRALRHFVSPSTVCLVRNYNDRPMDDWYVYLVFASISPTSMSIYGMRWRQHYIEDKFHSRLGYLSPEDYIKREKVSYWYLVSA